MINKNLIIILTILIIITLLLIFFILSIYFFKFHEKINFINDYFKRNNNKNYYARIDYENNNIKKDQLIKEDNKNEEDIKNIDIEKNEKNIDLKKDEKFSTKKIIDNKKSIINSNKTSNEYSKADFKADKNIKKELNKDFSYSKGSDLPDQSFHSYGDYISIEEEKYRESLIKNLKIKTVVIDRLTKGNGISQEFFKVVYQANMIPAKILEEVVESKDFRRLIPEKYLKEEIKIKGLKKGEEVVFKNEKIKDLLILWKMGRLSPIQKAWIVKADK